MNNQRNKPPEPSLLLAIVMMPLALVWVLVIVVVGCALWLLEKIESNQ